MVIGVLTTILRNQFLGLGGDRTHVSRVTSEFEVSRCVEGTHKKTYSWFFLRWSDTIFFFLLEIFFEFSFLYLWIQY